MIQLDLWQKEVLNTNGNICLCSGRQTGKSTIISIKGGEFAVKNSNKQVLIISATERQAEQLFIKCLMYLQDNYKGFLCSGTKRPTKHQINLKNGSIVRCLPVGLDGTGIRGYTTHLLIVDECAFINDSVFSAVTPQLLTTGGDIILLSTPHGRKGYFYECYHSKDFKTFHIKSEEIIRNREISASWSLLQQTKALEHLEREKASMTKLEYAQEYLGEFIEELRQFFPDELIKSCMKLKRPEKINKEKTYFLGVDVGRMGGDESTFEIIDRTKRDKLIHVESIVVSKVYLNEVTNRIIELDKQYMFRNIYIDDGGIGVGVFDYLLEKEQTRRKIIALNNRSRPLDNEDKHKKKILKEDLYNNLLGLMERREIEFLDDDEIFLSLKSVQFEYTTAENSLTKLKIFGNYTHIAEGLIRAAFCNKDKRLNIWVR